MIYFISPDLSYHDQAYMFLYCFFLNNGKFKIIYDGNYEQFDVNDPAADYLFEHGFKHEGIERNSWEEGYRFMEELIEKAYSVSIPEIPK